MSFFRSHQMKHYSLVVPRESAWSVMDQLGSLGQLHFVDYDPSLPQINRPFANYVKRCDESLFKLGQIEYWLKEFKKEIKYCKNVDQLMQFYKEMLKNRMKPGHTYFEEIEGEIDQKRNMLTEQASNWSDLKDRVTSINEQQQVLLKCQQLLGSTLQHPIRNVEQQPSAEFFDEIREMRVKFSQIIGVIDKEDEQRLKRMIHRVTKGNAWVQIVDIEQAQQLDKIIHSSSQLRCLFVVVYPAMNENSLIKTKLTKVCDSFSKSRYDFPTSTDAYHKKLKELENQELETQQLIQLSKQQILLSLDSFVRCQQGCDCSYFEQLRLYVIKEKYLYQNLNYLVMQGSIFTGNFWLPAKEDSRVEGALRNMANVHADRIPTGQMQEVQPIVSQNPPTYFKVNDVTWTFQEIVNTYGIPRYQEINPGLFAVITFPFLFGVMFADIGHGFLLFLLGLMLTFLRGPLEKSDSIFKLLIPGRYIILLMGFFAFYNGIIYNDYLSIPLNLFGSCYELKGNTEHDKEWVLKDPNCVYPFGVDPVWLASKSSLLFINSYKMKLAVIIGVIHMVYGILMKGCNNLYFKNKIDFFCEFIPQFLFMVCVFGWMDFLIIVKWFTVYPQGKDPSIIDAMIGQILQPFDKPEKPVFEGNAELQLQIAQLLTIIALLSVPWMLIPKPCILLNQQKKKHAAGYQKVQEADYPPLLQQQIQQAQRSDSELDLDPKQFEQALQKAANRASMPHKKEDEEKHDSGDIVVHQIIETIEFVLGGISNTASYLRLWALSLAHGQLAEVFYDQCIGARLIYGPVFGGLISGYGYLVFAMLTFGVLLTMDVMECFLHALRLHWVEFQSKFYKADGYLFIPYSFKTVLKDNAKPPEIE